MTDPNWLKHVKILGKLVYLWDYASAAVDDLKYTMAALVDQVASASGDADGSSWPVVNLLAPYVPSLNGAIVTGETALQALAVQICTAYLTSGLVAADLTNQPATPSNPASVLDAIIEEMTDDSKTFKTASAAGLVHFFTTNYTDIEGTFPQDGAPTYADATYVVQAVV